MFRRERMIVSHGHPIRIPPPLAEEYRRDDDRATYRRYSEMVMAAIAALRDEVSGD